GVNFFTGELAAKRLGLLHELVPKAVHIAVLVNPANTPMAEAALQDVTGAARAIGLQIQLLDASTSREIEAAFAALVRDRPAALRDTRAAPLYSVPAEFSGPRRVQFATLASRNVIPTTYSIREFPEVGGLMSYGTDIADRFHQAGVMSGQILKGAKPADLPVMQ